MSYWMILFLFLFSFAISSSSFVNTTHKCSVQQTQALLQFKHNLSSTNFTVKYSPCKNWLGSGYSPIMMNWNTSTDCCDWNGVTCDRSTGDVIGLDLSCGMLLGTIHPNTTLFHLPRLQRLNLAYNEFPGSQLPPGIGMVSNSLTHLNISFCYLSGPVPAEISYLRKLVSLDLSDNWINFDREPHVFINLLQNLTVLEELSLNFANISTVLYANLNISSYLRLLNLRSTVLQGKLPHNIFNLQSLENLDLSDNSFTGYISSEVSLPKLVSFDLSQKGFDNLQIQPHIFSMLLQNSTSLRDLRLSRVNIGMILPDYLNISSPLRSLNIRSTGLQGKLPHNILNLKYLEELDLSWNTNLSGPLPKINTSIGHLSSLVDMRLSNCRLNGSIPKSVGNLKHLRFLDLSSNMLSGTLPSSLFTLPSLEYMGLSNNQLTGQINVLNDGRVPQTFQKLTNLTILYLSNNSFRGDWELDTLLSSLIKLVALSLSHSGVSVTTSSANHYVNLNITNLSLASCSLKVLPMCLRNLKLLQHLDLSNNDIQGHIPDWVGEIGGNELLLFDLSNNSITGTIPDVYAGWVKLEGFILNGNQLEGKVPASLHKCQNLKIIDLGNNHLNDTFPSWLEDLPSLQALVLRSNSFHGGIVTSFMVNLPFPSLRVLDISRNGFVGPLPTIYFQNFNAMKNVVKSDTEPEYVIIGNMYYSIKVAVKGSDRDFPRLLVDYTVVDLSKNKFEREIPNIIGNLKSLKVLNLSHNSLSGEIPQALGNISEIESLDLSWNQLTGVIPQSLADLTSLAVLNLSQNHLIGRIPQGKQFNTFEGNVFGGNPKLCGFQLSKECNEQRLHQQLEGDGDFDDDERGITWEVVMIGYGCGIVLGFVLGYLMLSTERSNWFNSIADAAELMILKSKKKKK